MGDAAAQYNLALFYQNSMEEKREIEAVKLYQLAADQGYVNALNSLGICYLEGLGVSKDNLKAVKFFSSAAAQGVVAAQVNLGQCYENGMGSVKDEVEAFRLYKLAANQGH